MDIFKENFPNNVINDLYKLIVFSKIPCIVNIRNYKKEQFKLHRSLLGVKGGGENQTSSEEPCLQHFAVMVKINISMPNFS